MTLPDPVSAFPSKKTHHLDLERETVRALERADYRLAFALADRRCRIPPHPDARIYLLRAEALHHLGLTDAALESVSRACELDPDDLVAARRMMAWGSGARQIEAARTVAKFDSNLDTINSALRHLRDAGQDAFARTDLLDNAVAGWVIWKAPSEVRLTLTSSDQSHSTLPIADPKHRLAGPDRRAADFRIERPRAAESQRLQITQGDQLIANVQIPANKALSRPETAKASPKGALPHQAVFLTVIVPVHGDYAATEVCLKSALTAVSATPGSKIVLVDDASPEPRIKHLLHSLSANPNVTVLTNDHNLGFVGSVNRALRATPQGDVVLLNSDTLVPRNALERLRTVVRSTLGAGTATPLSNNGEFTSFPVANRSNPLPSIERVEALDRFASIANAGTAIDIPNGIGFCLYVTRECLNAVTELSDDFYRGYLEDVDLCLRAAEAGFRNVCVPSVFVGHEGSRSFLGEKRSLVVRNLRVLQQRYPRYDAECAAFLLADPIRDSRAALEKVILPGEPRDDLHLILSADGVAREIAVGRCQQLAAKGKRGLVVDFQSDGRRQLANIVDPAGGLPQSITFNIGTADDRKAFFQLLLDLAPRIELVDPRRIPREIVGLIRSQGLSYDILLADTGFAVDPTKQRGVCSKWQQFVDEAQNIIVTDRRAAAFAAKILGLKVQSDIDVPRIRQPASSKRAGVPCLGVLTLRSNVQEFQFIRELSDCVARTSTPTRLVVLGNSLDDVGLMQCPHVIVTGKIVAEDVRTLVDAHGINKLLLDLGDPLFGHPLAIAFEATGLPIATFDWTDTRKRPRKSDLRIAPGLSRQNMIELIVNWLVS